MPLFIFNTEVVSSCWSVLLLECPAARVSYFGVSYMRECPAVKVSNCQSVLLLECLAARVSYCQSVLLRECPAVECPAEECPAVECLDGDSKER